MLKDVSLERLTTAIRTLASGGTCIEPVITERIMRALERSNVAFDSADLPETMAIRQGATQVFRTPRRCSTWAETRDGSARI